MPKLKCSWLEEHAAIDAAAIAKGEEVVVEELQGTQGGVQGLDGLQLMGLHNKGMGGREEGSGE